MISQRKNVVCNPSCRRRMQEDSKGIGSFISQTLVQTLKVVKIHQFQFEDASHFHLLLTMSLIILPLILLFLLLLVQALLQLRNQLLHQVLRLFQFLLSIFQQNHLTMTLLLLPIATQTVLKLPSLLAKANFFRLSNLPFRITFDISVLLSMPLRNDHAQYVVLIYMLFHKPYSLFQSPTSTPDSSNSVSDKVLIVVTTDSDWYVTVDISSATTAAVIRECIFNKVCSSNNYQLDVS